MSVDSCVTEQQADVCLCVFVLTGPDTHGYSDSSDMVRAILQTVQNQDGVLKDLYTHLR